MPMYEYRCLTCDDRFELSRPMSESGDPASCPLGHDETVRLLSMFARSGAAAPSAAAPAGPTGGGCCGGGCGCG